MMLPPKDSSTPDSLRLRQHLNSLANSHVLSAGRLISGENPKALVLSIFKIVDETILPRVLTFQRDDGAFFEIEVAARRVLLVCDCSIGDADGLVGRLLCAPSDEDAVYFIDFLRRFLSDTVTLSVTTRPSASGSDPTKTGYHVEELVQILGGNLYAKPERPGNSVLTQILAEFSNQDCTWISLEGDHVSSHHGTDTQLERFRELCPENLRDFDRDLVYEPGSVDLIGCILVKAPSKKNEVSIFIRVCENRVFLVIPDDQSSVFLKLWTRNFSTNTHQ